MSENIAPSAPGAGAIDWPQRDHIAAILSFEEAIWPEAKPARSAEPPIAEPQESREPRKRSAASRGRSKNAVGYCRNGETNAAHPAPRCKPRVGHQLSLTTGTISPESVRSQYAF